VSEVLVDVAGESLTPSSLFKSCHSTPALLAEAWSVAAHRRPAPDAVHARTLNLKIMSSFAASPACAFAWSTTDREADGS
jgi:hypothetical protein